MPHKIGEIKDLDATAQQKLTSANIATVEQLLERTHTPRDRAALAQQLDVSSSQLTDWINRADLMRLKGVGTELANLFEEAGVDSCRELQHRIPENLHNKLLALNNTKKITHHAPTLTQLQQWISEAKIIVASEPA